MSKYVEEFWKEVKPEDFLKNRDMIVRVRNGHIGWSGPTKLDGYTLTSDSACEMINLHVNNKAWGMPEFPPVPVTYKVTWYANGTLYDECQMYDPHSDDKDIETFWRPATVEDIERFINGGKRLKSRFWRIPECPHEVYDPPEYWLNKPTPNPGYRLLNKFPHEDIAIGDEGWNTASKRWVTVTSPYSNKQPDEVWFSRRIEEPPAVSKTVVDQLRQGYVYVNESVHRPKVGDSVVFPSGLRVVVNEKGFTVIHG
jgi:hypothetical protein